jgi:hypothetical protein
MRLPSSTEGAYHTRAKCRFGKNSFHVVGHDQRGAIVLRQKWSRREKYARDRAGDCATDDAQYKRPGRLCRAVQWPNPIVGPCSFTSYGIDVQGADLSELIRDQLLQGS